MKRAFLAMCALAAFVVAAAEDAPRPIRLDVTSQPEGARVAVDGAVRGVTPLSLFDLKPGRHLVHVESEGWLCADEFVSLEGGAFAQKNYSLSREKGLLLVKTDPAGADVQLNGVSLGNTPLVLTSLNSCETHALDLVMPGHQKKRIEVALQGRVPQVREEKLVSDSGMISCESTPAGALVTANGAEVGMTPCSIENAPRGDLKIVFTREGYREYVRELKVSPGQTYTVSATLQPIPAKLRVHTRPSGATVFVDDNVQPGKSPFDEPFSVKPGKHKIRVERAGCTTATREIALEPGEEVTAEFDLDSVLARLEMTTSPARAHVFVDGKRAGTTKFRDGVAKSDALLVDGLEAGEHLVTVRLDGFYEWKRKIKLAQRETKTLDARLRRIFLPDTEVETLNGTYRGVLVRDKCDDERIVLETKPGIEQTIRRADIRKTKLISSK